MQGGEHCFWPHSWRIYRCAGGKRCHSGLLLQVTLAAILSPNRRGSLSLVIGGCHDESNMIPGMISPSFAD